ncbi:MAG: hypothetical protein ABI142_07340, partial [Bryocella sp.]
MATATIPGVLEAGRVGLWAGVRGRTIRPTGQPAMARKNLSGQAGKASERLEDPKAQPVATQEQRLQGPSMNEVNGTPKVQAGPSAQRPALSTQTQEQREARAAEQAVLSALAARCLAGDAEAWETLARTQHRRVYGLCFRFTNSQTDAEDLT